MCPESSTRKPEPTARSWIDVDSGVSTSISTTAGLAMSYTDLTSASSYRGLFRSPKPGESNDIHPMA